MVNYQQGKIYKLECNKTGLIYIGSTCRTLKERLKNHVRDYGACKLITSTQIIRNGNYKIELLEDYPCSNKLELNLRESHYCKMYECVNKVKEQGKVKQIGQIEYNKEYNKKNAEKICIQKQKYRERTKEEFLEKIGTKDYCPCCCSYFRHNDKARHLRTKKHNRKLFEELKQILKDYSMF